MDRIPATPALAKPQQITSKGGLEAYTTSLYRDLFNMFIRIASRLNAVLPKDGSEPFTGPPQLETSTVAELTSLWPAATHPRGLLYCSNETGGATIVFSDGTNWRRVQDRAIAS
jgi:hypothetical protein